MLSKHDSIQRDQLEMITLDQLVPPNHLVRKMEAAIDFTFIYDLVKDMYSELGRPSIDPVILVPYTRPRTKEGFFRKQDYVYDEHFDCYLCPSGETLKYSTTNKEGYREYKLPKQICTTCSFLSRCTESKDCQKVVTRHIWQTHVEEADHLRHHQAAPRKASIWRGNQPQLTTW